MLSIITNAKILRLTPSAVPFCSSHVIFLIPPTLFDPSDYLDLPLRARSRKIEHLSSYKKPTYSRGIDYECVFVSLTNIHEISEIFPSSKINNSRYYIIQMFSPPPTGPDVALERSRKTPTSASCPVVPHHLVAPQPLGDGGSRVEGLRRHTESETTSPHRAVGDIDQFLSAPHRSFFRTEHR